jgi:hypothetical protein
MLIDNASDCDIYGNNFGSILSSGVVLDGNDAADNFIYNNVLQDTPTPIDLTASAGDNTIYGNTITSQANVTLNIGGDGNSLYANSISGSQIFVNMTDANYNTFYQNNFLAPANTNITFVASGNNWGNNWDNGTVGNYWSDYLEKNQTNAIPIDGIWSIPYPIGNNTDRFPLVNPWTATSGNCDAIISVVAGKSVIGRGCNCPITVTAADNGAYPESFNVTAYANGTAIDTRQVNNLNAACQTVLTFVWNTTDLTPYGNYMISAYAQPVTGQTDFSGNNFTLGMVKVTIPGDIIGDFNVTLQDLVLLQNAYDTTPASGGSPGAPYAWNPNADIVGTNGANWLTDLYLLRQYYGWIENSTYCGPGPQYS